MDQQLWRVVGVAGVSDRPSSRYDREAVQQQIERDRRCHPITRKEERLIHALLKGRGD